MTPTELQQSNIRELLVEILAIGKPLQIDWDGKLFEIVSVEKKSKFDNLVPRPGVIIGDPEDLVNISWEHELNLDLPS
ncbi:MAG: hypothetical protein WBB82_02720 [Limnothrix sp.]